MDEYFKGIDDYIDMKEYETWFKMIHAFILGFQQGIHKDDEWKLDEDCFGQRWVTKMNQYEYLWYGNPFGNFYENFFPEASMTYQFYFMFFNTCSIDHTMQEFMEFCWYRGCWPKELVLKSQDKWLYILRDVNDEAIVWQDAATDKEDNDEKWAKVCQGTGKAVAEMFMDVTGFTNIIPEKQ